ncbi:uncharacterized protein LOC135391558 isoform X2 [Ornithodoros turicata]|uniref:uncharacterized protein LOC135391558 isoform X2 n=1 Tax=Ornithodoros turicata TaxID=34597 RepID=UPI003138FD6D
MKVLLTVSLEMHETSAEQAEPGLPPPAVPLPEMPEASAAEAETTSPPQPVPLPVRTAWPGVHTSASMLSYLTMSTIPTVSCHKSGKQSVSRKAQAPKHNDLRTFL